MIEEVALDGVRLDVDGVAVIDGVTLSWTERRLGVIGANGSGKSTLLRLLNALTTPTAGSLALRLRDGRSIDPARDAAAARAVVGFVFTDPAAQVVMPTPAEDIALSLRRLRLPAAERDARVAQVLTSVGLGDRADTSAHSLSSGQRQLLAVASVLAVDPALVVLDEPTTLLDLPNALAVERRIEELDQHAVVASHDLGLIERVCERVLVMAGGQVVADAGAAEAVAAYRALVTDAA